MALAWFCLLLIVGSYVAEAWVRYHCAHCPACQKEMPPCC